MATNKPVLFVDAYDSFSQNIIALLHEELNVEVELIHADTDVRQKFGTSTETFVSRHAAVVLGPGPGNPNKTSDVGMLYDLFDVATTLRIPILGICLGFQVLCVKYGLRVGRMKEPCHGQPKKIFYFESNNSLERNKDVFEGTNTDNIWATCYNSLGLALQDVQRTPAHSRPGSSGTDSSFSTSSTEFSVTNTNPLRLLAVDSEGYVMAIRHHELPFWGFQFHPESCRSDNACRQLVKNWWHAAQEYQKLTEMLNFDQVTLQEATTYDDATADPLSLPHLDRLYSESSSLTTSKIVSRLLDASVTTGNLVQWTKVRSNGDRRQISDLIHELSADCNIAMLESTKKGRFSIYAILAEQMFSAGHENTSTWQAQYQQHVFSIRSGQSEPKMSVTATPSEVWNGLEYVLAQKRAVRGPDEVPFWGGFIGYVSYEHGLDSLNIKPECVDDRSVSDVNLLWVERSIVYDNVTNMIYIQSIRKNDQHFINSMEALLAAPSKLWSCTTQQSEHRTSCLQHALETASISLPDRNQYENQFDRCQSELRAGNSYELCLTTEATITIPKPKSRSQYEFELYKNLHAHNPVPFGAFIRLPGITILGTSPEQYLSWSRNGTIDMIPMKGTVKRSADMTFAKASAILSTPKESAENLMIADLIRHDLYNTVGPRSKVEVVKLCEVVEHETVYQLVSHIRAHAPMTESLTDDERQQVAISYGFKALRQTLPPGSMTGAPKKRSCEILSQLEQRNRGVYSGVLGYMDVGGGGNWNVCIRTAFRSDSEGKRPNGEDVDVWHLGAGGAVTVLSDAEGEWQEMMVKLNSVLQGFKTVRT